MDFHVCKNFSVEWKVFSVVMFAVCGALPLAVSVQNTFLKNDDRQDMLVVTFDNLCSLFVCSFCLRKID